VVVAVVVGLLTAVPGLADVRRRFEHASVGWLLLAIAAELGSVLSYRRPAGQLGLGTPKVRAMAERTPLSKRDPRENQMSKQEFVTRIEQAPLLDRLADPLTAAVRNALPAGPLKDGLSGTWLGHPLHPLLTDVPIGAWTSSLMLDAVGGRESRRAADRLIAIGILAALPTAATGIADWGDTQPKERRVGLVHAVANTTALALFSGSLLARRRGRRTRGIVFSLAGAGALGAGGYLGGHLTFALGLGVDRTAFASPPTDWTDAIAENDVSESELAHATVNGVGAVLTRYEGEVVALADRCTHRGAPLHEGTLCDGAIVCPWHQSIFRLADGTIVQGPATRPAPRFEVRVRAGRVELRAARQLSSAR